MTAQCPSRHNAVCGFARNLHETTLCRAIRANQFFKLGNKIWCSTGIWPVFFGHGQNAVLHRVEN